MGTVITFCRNDAESLFRVCACPWDFYVCGTSKSKILDAREEGKAATLAFCARGESLLRANLIIHLSRCFQFTWCHWSCCRRHSLVRSLARYTTITKDRKTCLHRRNVSVKGLNCHYCVSICALRFLLGICVPFALVAARTELTCV